MKIPRTWTLPPPLEEFLDPPLGEVGSQVGDWGEVEEWGEVVRWGSEVRWRGE